MLKIRYILFALGSLLTLGALAVNLAFIPEFLKGHQGTTHEVQQTILSALFQFFIWQLILFFVVRVAAKNIILKFIATFMVAGTCLMFFQNAMLINGVQIHQGLKIVMNLGQLLCLFSALTLWYSREVTPSDIKANKSENYS